MTERPSATAAEFRTLMGRFASGVTVATAIDGNGRAVGMTATAVAAVSLDPPLVLVGVNHSDPLHGALERARTFGLNVLASDQEIVSRRFAADAAERFDGVPYHTEPHGVPLLDGVVAAIVCERWHAVPAGDHTLFIGRVLGGVATDRAPLLHFRGGYATAEAL